MDDEMSLDFYQIFYHESQRNELYPFAKPYFSVGLTPYFENAIIAGLVPFSSADFISVCSWRLRKKRGDAVLSLGGFGSDILSLEKIEKAMPFDVAILTPRSPTHQPLVMAANWHGKAWVDAFEAFKPFLAQFGKVPQELVYSVYENHFIARKEIYHEYVKDWLIPAIEFMEKNSVFFADSLYLPKKRDQEEIRRVQTLLGRKDWPIAPFILERLFAFFINDKGFKMINL